MKETNIEWQEKGLQAVTSKGTTVAVLAAKNGDAYDIRLETPIEGEEPFITHFGITAEAFGIVASAIIELTGLNIPGFGVIKLRQTGREAT